MKPAAAKPGATLYWSAETDGSVSCRLCGHRCRIASGGAGRCGVRTNRGGVLHLPFHGRVTAVHIDPVEKKPLYHVRPGGRILSIGFLGCNFRCPFCQNYEISQSTTAATRALTPAAACGLAVESGGVGVAYTYNEPTIHLEYVLETARLVRVAGLLNVVVTNGHLLSEPAKELCAITDAFNVDLKSFDPDYYRTVLGGSLETVKEFITIAAAATHVEVTTLLVPGVNDSPDEVRRIAEFLGGLRRDLPLHLSAYHPAHRMTAAATPAGTIAAATSTAREALDYVYPGNTSLAADTRCPGCGSLLIERQGYSVRVRGLDGSSCRACGRRVPLV